MRRVRCQPRADWQAQAQQYGFDFHTMYGQPYWDESAYYCFTLAQIENDLEQPTAELHQMCLEVVEQVVNDERLLRRFCVPQPFWDVLLASWRRRDPSLYSRLDLSYSGNGPAKLLENNADTPTSLYETGFWQWLWLEDSIRDGRVNRDADQFNSLQDQLIDRLRALASRQAGSALYVSCAKDSVEDRGTVQYLQDCAADAGIDTRFIYVEDIGYGSGGRLTDLDDTVINWLFKLYPWEFMLRERFAPLAIYGGARWLEPLWKSLLSNKALLPMLWRLFPNHPNLLPACFEDELAGFNQTRLVKKPIFAREGANVSILENGKAVLQTDGPYGEEGYIYQRYHPLPVFDDNHTLIGSWLVDDSPAGISLREDISPITQDLSRFLPHIITD